MEGIRVSGIELTTKSGDTVKLTVEEARALLAQLLELFGASAQHQPVPVLVPMPYPAPVYPMPRPILIPEQWPSPWRPRWEITCGTSVKHLARTDGSGLAVSYRGDTIS